MEYIVSARKYRPMSFDSVVGQSALTTTLKNAVKTGKLAHAYLFCGPRGVGKTTCARIFARAINCQNPTQEGEACGSCESCKSFEEGRSYSIFELDAASNNSVEDIKTLMEQTRIPPQVGSYKVFIIDEVHMLSTAAFNAFLKTLEEPPAHVIFILATTEKHKLLPTIISRCQIYDFERMTVQNTIDHLKMVAEKEGYTYEEEALAVIAEKADGGMRDALSIFDQAASFCKGNITYEKVIEDLNVLDEENYFQIVDLAIANNVAEIMLLVNKVIARGFDGGNLCQGLASHIRNVMMGKDPKTMQLLECSAQHKARYVEQAQKCSTLFLYTALRILNQCDINYRQSSNKRLLVELSLIQVAQITQSEEEAPSAGRSPKRLKTLFKNIALQAKPKKTVQQVTEAKPVEFTASMSEQKSVVEKPVVSRSGLKLSSLGFTFAGVTPQATLCITNSPVHTVEYYAAKADLFIEAGAPEICLKDMAGVGMPGFLGRLTKAIKTKHPDVIIEYHGHSGPGLSMASILEVCENGGDIIDTAIEPMSWGNVHPDVISVREMLKDAGFDVPEINMNAYMKARSFTQEFIDDWLGYFINPANKHMSSLLLGCGLPGGMMGSMMADLGGIQGVINNLKKKKGEPELNTDDMLVALFNEVEYVWPKVGFPPLVTPFSQYVKNIALFNLLTIEQGKGRYVMMDDSIWGMILGKSGKVPGELAPEIVELAKEQGREFVTDDPRTFYPNNLEDFKKEMDENGWEYGQDNEELFELAMHPEQYRNYKSGQAKKNFLADLQKEKDAALGTKITPEELAAFKHAKADAIVAPCAGQLFWEMNGEGECAPSVEPYIGKEYAEGDVFCFMQATWGELLTVPAALGGKLVEINAKQGAKVRKGDVIAYIERKQEA